MAWNGKFTAPCTPVGGGKLFKKLFLVVLVAGLVLLGRDLCNKNPELDRTVKKHTKTVRVFCKDKWRSTTRFCKRIKQKFD